MQTKKPLSCCKTLGKSSKKSSNTGLARYFVSSFDRQAKTGQMDRVHYAAVNRMLG